MSDLAKLFLDNLLPIFLAAGAGFLLGKWLKVEPRTLSQTIFYIFSPCLVFRLITSSQLSNQDFVRMFSFAVTLIFITGMLTYVLGRLFRFERRLLMAVLLTSMIMNAGNYGLSVNLFAFGEEGLAHASLFFVTSGITTYTVGVVIASMGSRGIKDAMMNLLRLPFVYALILAFTFVYMKWELPVPLERTVNLLGNAAIPAMLVLLGLQIQKVQWDGNWGAVVLVNSMRLVVAPLIAILMSPVFNMQGAARQAAILESGMPTAVLVTVLATEYDLEPSFITSVVFTSTFLSPLTLTPLLDYLL